MFEDPGVGLVGNLGENEQVVATETRTVLPVVTVLVDPAERHVVADAVLGIILSDRSFDAAQTNVVNGLFPVSCHVVFLLLVWLKKRISIRPTHH